ncbi:MAG: tail fiber domain-containing protein [Sphingobacteriales bacterium]|nr:tail fiber domain-containing protein [Sphingobacteriales bacterium]MBP9140598.1 tail fiber domain-containing protein [Chitinophagales bacterium]MDA0197388.1 tail fiber domain-containing protein [Bacteroidota bacterium]MBK6888662.1 tail fiber domain-containing protein [Sphingobacteriales bacterium]MBK7528829.1 tail fiber domain-containing protein [Sphingobacteriales bacterium]
MTTRNFLFVLALLAFGFLTNNLFAQWTDGGAKVYLTNGGDKVGIGTSAPSTNLHVVGAENNGSTAAVKIESGTQIMLIDGNEIDATTDVLGLNYNSSKNVIIANGGGSVGIGKSSPAYKLDVAGSIGLTGSLRYSNASTPMAYIYASGTINSERAIVAHSPSYANYGLFYRDSDDRMFFKSNGTTRVAVDLHNGRLGVGTDAPTKTLDVVGTARITGQVTVATNQASDKFGVGFNTPLYKLDVNGNTYCSGGVWTASDARFKENVQQIGSALDKVKALSGVSYQYKTNEFAGRIEFQEGNTLGFIAQDLQKVLPEAVMNDGRGYLAVNYSTVIPVLVEAIKESETQKQALENKVTALEQQIAAINAKLGITPAAPVANPTKAENSKTTVAPVAKIVKGSVAQNHPNPAKDVTSISYAIDKNTANAQIVITDMAGRTLQQINITDGAGNVNINTNNFANGAYIYSLVIDGQTVESKQMVVNK